MGAVLALMCALQADPFEWALELFARIEREDTEDREAARYQLTLMDPSFAPSLRKMAPFQNNPAVKSAIQEAIPQLFHRWGKSLYAEGRVEEALDCFAEAGEAQDVKKDVRAKVDDAKGFLTRWVHQQKVTNCLGPSIGISCSNRPDLVKSIQGTFGPWGMAAVLEGTRESFPTARHYWTILSQMGDEAVPVLCREVKSLNQDRKRMAFSELYSMAREFRVPRPPSLWLETSKAVAEDASESESVRKEAREMAEFLRR
jgi:hypothetical protein